MRSATNIIIVELIIAVLQSDFAFAFEHIDIYIYIKCTSTNTFQPKYANVTSIGSEISIFVEYSKL